MAPQPGQIIGTYEIIAPLGSGGMGDVYRARDLRLGRHVAIKFVSSRLHGNADAEARLDREARMASALNHAGIVAVYDVGRHEERPYVVMELIEGRPMTALLAESRLPLKEAIDLAAQIADALATAHAAGIIHRDLKPQNVMVTADGRAKVVDFGLSKLAPAQVSGTAETIQGEALTGDYAVLGTAGYMAPEQVMGLPADGRADQFALGSMLYEMLTGRRAFRRDTSVQTMSAILEDDPAPIPSVRPDVPASVISIVGRCLAKRPERRYASTRDLAHDLRDVHEQLVLDSRSGPQPWRPRPTPWRWVAAAATVAVLAVLAGVLIWPRLAGRPAATAAPALRYVVIMPLTNVTKEPSDQVFADGLVETLTSSLTQLERYQRLLRVVPASEVRAGRIESIRDARQAFGVTLAISGSIQRLPSSMRLTLNLVDAAELVQLGSRTIDIGPADEMVTQDTVAGAATALLALELEPDERRALAAGGTSAKGAFQLYVQGRGYLYRFDRGADNVDLAIELLGRAVSADPRYALAHTALAEAFWRKYEINRDPKLIDQAVTHCEQALAIDSRLAPVHITLAMLARGRGRYEEAIAVAQRAIELDPVNSEAYRELGRAQEAVNRLADAETTYRKAIEARPDDWQSYNTLGSFYLGRSRWPEAEAAYQRVIELTPDNTRGYNNLGVTYFRMDRDEDAARMWERSLAIRPNFSAASNLGTSYFRRGQYSQAARAFERAVALAPADVRVWRNLAAALYWAPGERPKARPAFEKVVQLAEAERQVNPRQPALLAQLADAYAMLGSTSEALAAATAVERLGVADAETAFVLAGVYEQLGNREIAFSWLSQALAKGYALDTIERSPSMAELRKDARYRTLVDRAITR
ncbi:MAG TPA: tetratricopeptide repeat protein [Vicinamibacterales bacterium]|nr:tetratricopeptide repeat protein [Vicinamibacterales bacterium]